MKESFQISLAIFSTFFTIGFICLLYILESKDFQIRKSDLEVEINKTGFISIIDFHLRDILAKEALSAFSLGMIIILINFFIHKIIKKRNSKIQLFLTYFAFLLIYDFIKASHCQILNMKASEFSLTKIFQSFDILSILCRIFETAMFCFAPENYSKAFFLIIPVSFLSSFINLDEIFSKKEPIELYFSTIFGKWINVKKTDPNAAELSFTIFIKLIRKIFEVSVYVLFSDKNNGYYIQTYFEKAVYITERLLLIGPGVTLFIILHECAHSKINSYIGTALTNIWINNCSELFGTFFYFYYFKKLLKSDKNLKCANECSNSCNNSCKSNNHTFNHKNSFTKSNENSFTKFNQYNEILINLKNFIHGFSFGFLPTMILVIISRYASKQEELFCDQAIVETGISLPQAMWGSYRFFTFLPIISLIPMKYIKILQTHPDSLTRLKAIIDGVKNKLNE